MIEKRIDVDQILSRTALTLFSLACASIAVFLAMLAHIGVFPVAIANKPEVRFVHEHVFLPGEVAEVQPNGTVKLRHPDDVEVEP